MAGILIDDLETGGGMGGGGLSPALCNHLTTQYMVYAVSIQLQFRANVDTVQYDPFFVYTYFYAVCIPKKLGLLIFVFERNISFFKLYNCTGHFTL
jgi:hypothetical protein